jgi:proton-translocating NADH-quinone oxidoreductase chain M
MNGIAIEAFGYENILLAIILIPLIGSGLILCIPEEYVKSVRSIGVSIALLNLVISQSLWVLFDSTSGRFQFVSKISWEGALALNVKLGVDGISIFFILLTTLLIPLCLISSWQSISKNVKEFVIAFLVMESALCIVFTVLDIMVFYIFFETILIPMFLVIGVWGSRTRKIRAAYQLFFYTLIGSLLMLLAIILILFETGTTDLQLLLSLASDNVLSGSNVNVWSTERQMILWLAFFASFAVKVPMFPFHIWLPEAHVEAPTAGSVLLAGILLKLGTYGFIRFSIPLFPEASLYFTPLIYTLSVLAIIYTSLTTLRQIDLKKVIAYSSVAHMGFVTIGLFTNTIAGIEGALLIMISHGFVSSALFLCVGVLYDRHHTRIIKYYSGLAQSMPLFSFIFVFFTLANLGLPGTSSFPGEFLTLVGAAHSSPILVFFAGSGMVLGAAYSIWLCNRLLFGGATPQKAHALAADVSVTGLPVDINRREAAVFLPLIFLTLWMGVYPSVFLNLMHLSVSLSIY